MRAERITVSRSSSVSSRCVSTAMRERTTSAQPGCRSPGPPVFPLDMTRYPASAPPGRREYLAGSCVCDLNVVHHAAPDEADLAPAAAAIFTICWIRGMDDAKHDTITLRVAARVNSQCAPHRPLRRRVAGRSTFVLSLNSARTPSAPYCAKACRSNGCPSIGVRSILKSPV